MNLWGCIRQFRGIEKEKNMKYNKLRFPLDLQFFAESGSDAGNGSGAGDNTGDAAGAADNNTSADNGKDGSQGIQSFDDILKNPAYQSEFDKRVAKALETQKTKLNEDIAAQIENARTEAEKFARMNAEQKAQYEKEKKEKELAEREAKLNERELKATARETLSSKGLPETFAEILNYTSAEACSKHIEVVEQAYKEALAAGIAAGVEEQLKGGRPPKKAPEGTQLFTRAQIQAMTPEEINNNWDAVKASMKDLS